MEWQRPAGLRCSAGERKGTSSQSARKYNAITKRPEAQHVACSAPPVSNELSAMSVQRRRWFGRRLCSAHPRVGHWYRCRQMLRGAALSGRRSSSQSAESVVIQRQRADPHFEQQLRVPFRFIKRRRRSDFFAGYALPPPPARPDQRHVIRHCDLVPRQPHVPENEALRHR